MITNFVILSINYGDTFTYPMGPKGKLQYVLILRFCKFCRGHTSHRFHKTLDTSAKFVTSSCMRLKNGVCYHRTFITSYQNRRLDSRVPLAEQTLGKPIHAGRGQTIMQTLGVLGMRIQHPFLFERKYPIMIVWSQKGIFSYSYVHYI